MSKTTLYTGMKTDLLTVYGVKTVALWRNQIERENIEQPFLYPAVFIEFLPSDYSDLLNGVQMYNMTVRLHICFESYKDEDTDVLTLVEDVYTKMNMKQYGYFGVLKRRNEEQNFDHNNVQDYIQDYEAGACKDFGSDKRPVTPVTIDTIDIITEKLT